MADRGPPGRASTTEEQLRRNWVVEPPRLTGKLQVVDYDPRWPALFRREAARIRALLGERALRLEHIGSTSVPEPAAKPIIDILLVVADPADEPAYLPDLEAAGYVLVIREPEWFQHRCLKGPDTDINLHLHPPGVRAALCNDLYTARLSREHNDANVLSMGGRIVAFGLADEILELWLGTEFAGGRHQRRVDQILEADRLRR